MAISRREFLTLGAASVAGAAVPGSWAALAGTASGATTTRAARSIGPLPMFVDELPIPNAIVAGVSDPAAFTITMSQFAQQLHRDLPPTQVYGYNGSFPGPTVVARRGLSTQIRWVNELPTTHLLPVDTTVHGADDSGGGRSVTHLHGGHIPSNIDGGPFNTIANGESVMFGYPNNQLAATLWYHDHAAGITRLNVMAGLAGFYLLKDDQEDALGLPTGAYEIGLAIQDRTFDRDGQLWYPPTITPEFFGDTVLVNGKVWPKLSVEPRKYRFRILNGSNSRFYRMPMPVPTVQIGSDGGFLPAPVRVSTILLAPGERVDVVMDFSNAAGAKLVLTNDATIPFPFGARPSKPTTQIMRFDVSATKVADDSVIPSVLPKFQRLDPAKAKRTRNMQLVEMVDEYGRVMPMLNNRHFWDPIVDRIPIGQMEIWAIENQTPDSHPIHLHLVQFQIIDRNGAPPPAHEAGWKDTVRVDPGETVRIIARFADYTGTYVWHCHILEHEEHDMMLPFEVY